MTCCNNNCNQGRTCPLRERRRGLGLGNAALLLAFAALVFFWIGILGLLLT